MTDPLLPIGRFARLCRLSVKQLRHYDELGLLPPAMVDPHTGYRYYRRDQARDALSIGLLRTLDVPLAAIGRVLAGDRVAETLGEVRTRLEADVARRLRILAALDRVLSDGLPVVDVTIVTEPARRVALVRDTGDADRIGEVTSRCVARLLDALGAAGVRVDTSLIGLFPLDLPQQLTVAAALPTDRDVPGTATELLPGGPHASATHLGPYDHISLTGHALLAWCADHGHTPAGPLYEVYRNDPNTTAPEHLVTHLMIKLEEQ
ncbi:MerR family transcriptional regulator [Actinophytocola sp.]|uniref:MerR family transcriptional regulator n=1 Tax=Actinophytocola sp. TaxID=1872138 RepID=UPI002D80063D|nr:MerR family transcriptional regulator [Actinophytocola sp.]HET9137775.1 MerR family transcriptional regulator [Actinophytocola sp.]